MPLSNSQYDSILRIYAAKQAASRQELDARLARIHDEIPGLKEVEEKIVSRRASKVRQAVMGRDDGAGGSEESLDELISRKEALLSSHGYTAEDLEPKFTCPDCRDTGFTEGEKCHCFVQAEIDLLYSQSELKEVLERENFSTFSYEWYEGEDRAVMRQNVAAARMFIEDFDTSPQNLLLMGGVGTGKTFLSNCIAKELIESRHSVVYLTAFRLFELLSRSAFSGRREGAADTDPYIFDCDLLIIDDLGTELSNSFTVSQFFLCINERMLRRKSTLISTNLDMEGLRRIYTERTFSRIISSYTIRKLPGKDIRLKKQLAAAARP